MTNKPELKDFVPGRLVFSTSSKVWGFIVNVNIHGDRYPTASFVWQNGNISEGGFIQWFLDKKREQVVEFHDTYLEYWDSETLNAIVVNLHRSNGLSRYEWGTNALQELLKKYGV